MKNHKVLQLFRTAVLTVLLILGSCTFSIERNCEPELVSLRQGLKTSVAIGYCASVSMSVHNGSALPSNVILTPGSGIIRVHPDAAHPVPFNKNAGDILIATLWNGDDGIMSVMFTGFNVPGSSAGLFGLYAVPLKRMPGGTLKAFYARQNIILGHGSDTIMNLSSALLDSRLDLTETEYPDDIFVAVKQNFWIVTIDQNNTSSNPYDDFIITDGGGQIAEAEGEEGGVVYHALINARVNYSLCSMNPVSGMALTQNFKAGGEPLIDMGNSVLSFHSACDGKAHIDFSSGKYSGYSNKDILLEIE
jgi:hypothetical protein